MKHFTLLVLWSLTFSMAAQSPFGPKPEPVRIAPEIIHDDLEEMPLFPGGTSAMQKYLEEHIVRPPQMREICSGTRLTAGFVVEKDGSLSQISIVKSVNGCPDFDFEVLRVIKNMPKWEPGKLNGRWVRCYYKMPVYID